MVENETAMRKLIAQDELPIAEMNNTIKGTAVEEAIKMLYERENIEMRTDLSPPMILAMSRGDVFVKLFKSDVMNSFMESVKVLSVSKGRKGRGELVSLVRNAQEIEDVPDLSFRERILSKNNDL